MPSFQDSVIIFILALILFGPKKLPQLARQLGKLMAEFRRASNDFRMQMEEEMRVVEQEENQKKLEANVAEVYPTDPQPLSHTADDAVESTIAPIASEGEVTMMPPSSGYPEPAARSTPAASSNAGVVATPEPLPATVAAETEPTHG